MIRVQQQDFDVGEEYQALVADDASCGAAVLFVGKVRDLNQGHQVSGLYLEHYPAMTEKYLTELEAQARDRWPLERVTIIHRVGELKLADQIVLVGVTSSHREAAFCAAQFMMDRLKTEAPFWKKEVVEAGESRWVEANQKDQEAVKRW